MIGCFCLTFDKKSENACVANDIHRVDHKKYLFRYVYVDIWQGIVSMFVFDIGQEE